MTAMGKYVQHMSSLMELIAISRLTSKCDLLHDSLDTGVREMRADIKASPGKELGTVFLMGETVWIKQWAGSVTWACKGLEWEDPEESGTEESRGERRVAHAAWEESCLRSSQGSQDGNEGSESHDHTCPPTLAVAEQRSLNHFGGKCQYPDPRLMGRQTDESPRSLERNGWALTLGWDCHQGCYLTL